MLPSIFGESLLDEFFDTAFDRRFFGDRDPLYGKHAKNLMKTDIKELDGRYEMDVDLPGFRKEDVNIELKDGYLTISALKGMQKDEKDEAGRYIRQERYSGQCSRSFYVGEIRAQDIKAKYEDGILRLSLPKQDQKALPVQNRIAIE